MYTPIEIKRNNKYGNNYWEAFSPKLKRNVRFFSDLEYDHWVHVEANCQIESFCEQPLKIQVWFKGELVESIFDMWILYTDKTEEFIEVKYESELIGNNKKSIRSIRQTNVQRQWCLLNNYKYSIKTEKDIRKDLIYLNNLKQIISQVRSFSNPNEQDFIKVTDCLADNPKRIVELRNLTDFDLSYLIQIASWLYYTGICNIEIKDAELNLQTEVSLIAKKENI